MLSNVAGCFDILSGLMRGRSGVGEQYHQCMVDWYLDEQWWEDRLVRRLNMAADLRFYLVLMRGFVSNIINVWRVGIWMSDGVRCWEGGSEMHSNVADYFDILSGVDEREQWYGWKISLIYGGSVFPWAMECADGKKDRLWVRMWLTVSRFYLVLMRGSSEKYHQCMTVRYLDDRLCVRNRTPLLSARILRVG